MTSTPFSTEKRFDLELLILRLGIGLMFATVHGFPKIAGGFQEWTSLGKTFNGLTGVDLIPAFWGFMSAIAEFGGGICLVLGIFYRIAIPPMLFTMLVAIAMNFRGGYGFSGAGEAIEMAAVLTCLMISGPGRFNITQFFRPVPNS